MIVTDGQEKSCGGVTNQALHVAVIVRMRYCTKTRAYVARRTREGLTGGGSNGGVRS
jgi:hypothetical protein